MQEMDAYPQIGQSNIFSLLFFEVSLFLKFFSLIMVSSFWTRNPYGYWAFENLIANLRIYLRFPCIFPCYADFGPFRDRFAYDCTPHHPVFRYRTPRVIRAFVP